MKNCCTRAARPSSAWPMAGPAPCSRCRAACSRRSIWPWRPADKKGACKALGKPLFVQISDTHIGFNKEANPDVNGTLTQTIDIVNGMSEQPALIIHTGDITHLSKPAEFDLAQQLFTRLRTTEMHTVPGEHDTTDATVTEYFNRFGKASDNKGYYSFDHAGVHFIGAHQCTAVQAGRAWHLGGGAARLGRGRLEGTLGEHPDRGLCPHAAVDDLRALGLGYR